MNTSQLKLSGTLDTPQRRTQDTVDRYLLFVFKVPEMSGELGGWWNTWISFTVVYDIALVLKPRLSARLRHHNNKESFSLVTVQQWLQAQHSQQAAVQSRRCWGHQEGHDPSAQLGKPKLVAPRGKIEVRGMRLLISRENSLSLNCQWLQLWPSQPPGKKHSSGVSSTNTL